MNFEDLWGDMLVYQRVNIQMLPFFIATLAQKTSQNHLLLHVSMWISTKWWSFYMIAKILKKIKEQQRDHLKKNIIRVKMCIFIEKYYIHIYIYIYLCVCLLKHNFHPTPPHVLFDVIHHHLHPLCDCHTSTDQTDSGSTRRPLQNLQGIGPLMCFRQRWKDRKDQHLWIVHPHLLGGKFETEFLDGKPQPHGHYEDEGEFIEKSLYIMACDIMSISLSRLVVY